VTTSLSEPHVALAIAVARADLAYLLPVLLRSNSRAELAFVQYAVMTSYETRLFFEKQVGVDVPEALWSEEIAKSARMSGKYLDDKQRGYLPGLVSYFDKLVAANRSFFLPETRRWRCLDWLRHDWALLLLDGVPVMSNVGEFFAAGVRPDQVMDQDSLGPHFRDLAAGVGQTASWVGAPQDHRGPLEVDSGRIEWWDAHSSKVVGQVFCGDFDVPTALAMLTIQNAATAADRLSRTDCCAACQGAALKHRMIVAYECAVSLQHLRDSRVALSASGGKYLGQALNDPHCLKLLKPGYRKLRNGLLHLGFTDIPATAGSSLTFDDVLCSYTGESSPSDVLDTVDGALAAVARALEAWCLTPPKGGKGLRAMLHRPPADTDGMTTTTSGGA
jgi:hypothetical protein